ncbi:hypothetical protein D7W81_36295 [Corallococcus aberystwythensis]|uniref:Uncharacterized protein n=1 Tax=Corallococcus aberystwythensis TaxID=2316722 RepID=A0A3A8PGE7_9BACT|nr:hypothetical protein D7W81_36295 [Corallococcus aberystwythensis]
MSPPNPVESPASVSTPAPTTTRLTTFLKPRFGITVQCNTLCVAVSARPCPDAPRSSLNAGRG